MTRRAPRRLARLCARAAIAAVRRVRMRRRRRSASRTTAVRIAYEWPSETSAARWTDSGRTARTRRPLRPDGRNRWAQPGPGPTIPGAEPGEGALGSYLRAVRSHLVLVIAITVAAGIAAVAWDQLRTPSYQTSAQMLVTPISSD